VLATCTSVERISVDRPTVELHPVNHLTSTKKTCPKLQVSDEVQNDFCEQYFTDEMDVFYHQIYHLKSGSTWLGWNVADLPPAFSPCSLASDTSAPR